VKAFTGTLVGCSGGGILGVSFPVGGTTMGHRVLRHEVSRSAKTSENNASREENTEYIDSQGTADQETSCDYVSANVVVIIIEAISRYPLTQGRQDKGE